MLHKVCGWLLLCLNSKHRLTVQSVKAVLMVEADTRIPPNWLQVLQSHSISDLTYVRLCSHFIATQIMWKSQKVMGQGKGGNDMNEDHNLPSFIFFKIWGHWARVFSLLPTPCSVILWFNKSLTLYCEAESYHYIESKVLSMMLNPWLFCKKIQGWKQF